jgi:hypothetical protein
MDNNFLTIEITTATKKGIWYEEKIGNRYAATLCVHPFYGIPCLKITEFLFVYPYDCVIIPDPKNNSMLRKFFKHEEDSIGTPWIIPCKRGFRSLLNQLQFK